METERIWLTVDFDFQRDLREIVHLCGGSSQNREIRRSGFLNQSDKGWLLGAWELDCVVEWRPLWLEFSGIFSMKCMLLLKSKKELDSFMRGYIWVVIGVTSLGSSPTGIRISMGINLCCCTTSVFFKAVVSSRSR